MDPTITGALIGVGGTVVGVGGGWLLAQQTAREERQWSVEQSVRQRLDQAAAHLDEALVVMLDDMPRGVESVHDARARLNGLRAKFADARTRWAVLEDEGIELRIRTLDTAIFSAQQDCTWAAAKDIEEVNFFPLTIGFVDLRKALTAYQRREELPPMRLPAPREQLDLVGGNYPAMERLNEYLIEKKNLLGVLISAGRCYATSSIRP